MQISKMTIGRNVRVDLVGHVHNVPAKIDTGADSSSLWVSQIDIPPSGVLQFSLFDTSSPLYTGDVIKTKHYRAVRVRSSSGHEEIRYRVIMPVVIKGKRIKVTFNLSDRSKNQFPILIGRRTLNKKFIVDVSVADDDVKPKQKDISETLSYELQQNPHEFFKKYHGRDL
jgi:hypothetical protein